MNSLKRTLALIATLALASTALVGCGGNGTSSTSSVADSSSVAEDSSAAEGDSSAAEGDSSAAEGDSSTAEAAGGEVKLPTDGDTLTIMSWNTEFGDMVKNYYCKDNGWTDNGDGTFTKDGVTLEVVAHGVGGGEASQYYDQYFDSGKDLDLYCVEADWALNYLGNDAKSAALSDVGITEAELADQYQYTKDIGTTEDGVLKGVSWQCAPGGFAYRTDLAEQYLGVKTPEEMQEKVKDWDTFMATAEEVYTASADKKTALTTSLDGVWQVFSANRDSAWVEDNKLVVNDEITNFVDMAHTMYEKGYVCPGITQWSSDGSWLAKGQTDETMGYFVSTWGIGETILESAAGGKGGATYGKWNLVTGPNDYYWGGTWLTVSPTCDNADIVADIIRYFTVNADTMKSYALASSDFVNNKTVMQGIVDSGENKNENLGGQDQFAVFMEAADKIDLAGKITKYDSDIKLAFQTAYDKYNTGDYTSVDETIEAFKDEVAAKITDLTWDE